MSVLHAASAAITSREEAAVSHAFQSIDPLTDQRWPEFLSRHPRASVFHTPAWLEALRQTYGYTPLVFTTARPGEALRNGVVFSKVRSWLVRPHLVSLPFSDHVDPLLDDPSELPALLAVLKQGQARGQWRSAELRPPAAAEGPKRGRSSVTAGPTSCITWICDPA
jgi:hypothetical protein